MDKIKTKRLMATVIALLGLLTVIASEIVVFNVHKVDPFSGESLSTYVSYMTFGMNVSFLSLLPYIGVVLGTVLFILDLVLLIKRKRPIYLFSTIMGLVAISDGSYTLAIAVEKDLGALGLTLALVGIALALAALILTYVFLLRDKEDFPAYSSGFENVDDDEEEKEEEKEAEKKEEVEEEAKEDDGSVKAASTKPTPTKPTPTASTPTKQIAAKAVSAKPIADNEEKASSPIKEEKKEENPIEVASKEEKVVSKTSNKNKKKTKEEEEKVEPIVEDKNPNKVQGKYEVFPEAGFYKYRLKANNGEILLVSNGYRTREGARSGIATLKKNMEGGISKIVTDKNGYSQFRVFTPNDSRLVAAGEYYGNAMSAQKALSSAERFYSSDKIVDLDDILEEERREWKVDLPPMNPSKNGKFEVYLEEESKKWQGRLIANNGAILFVTSTYSSKNAVLNAFVNIKSKALEGNLDIARDKMNRYHFRVVSDNGSIILMGETYPSRDSAISAAVSVRNFIGDAKVIDLTRGE